MSTSNADQLRIQKTAACRNLQGFEITAACLGNVAHDAVHGLGLVELLLGLNDERERCQARSPMGQGRSPSAIHSGMSYVVARAMR